MKMLRILFSLGLATLLSISAVAQQQLRQANREPSSQTYAKDVYNKWLTEDVAYIITDEETRFFSQLKSDEERERFIEEFWLRRDPTPDTDENDYRKDHYERIAFANQDFTAAGVPGWRTDRGSIFIRYGKPDEIQKTASEEIWLYKGGTGPGEVEFVWKRFEFRNNTLVR
jgi:GWxTD domain-containing protein